MGGWSRPVAGGRKLVATNFATSCDLGGRDQPPTACLLVGQGKHVTNIVVPKCKENKTHTVIPWATGHGSGRHQVG